MDKLWAVGAACLATTVAVAVAVLVGWGVGNEVLTSVVPGLTAMNPLTAVCFILSSVALLVWGTGATGTRRLVTCVLAIAVATFALARLGVYVVGWDLALDQILFRSRLSEFASPSNRMAPNTAFNFAVLGLMILSIVGGRAKAAQVAAGVVMLSSAAALLGYAFSQTSLVQVAAFVPMALHSAILFLLVCSAGLCRAPAGGLFEGLVRRTMGGRVFRRMVPAVVFGPPVFGWLRLQGELSGLYSASFGVALFVAVIVVTGLAMTFVTAQAVDRGEAERTRADALILKLAHYDALTGLPNRLLLQDRLRGALARAERSGDTVATLFLDLDGFKRVNDELGHAAGDQLLQEAARRIESEVRSVDTAARLGGDEFVVVLEQIKSAKDVTTVAQRLLGQLGRPFLVAGVELQLSASVGVSQFPHDSRTPETLLSLADAAMYRAKRAGKNQVAFHAGPVQGVPASCETRSAAASRVTPGPVLRASRM